MLRRLLHAALISTLLLGLAVSPAAASADRIDASIRCSREFIDFGEYSRVGQIDRVRGAVERCPSLDAHEYLAGDNIISIDLQINRVTGRRTGHGTFHIISANYPGSGWEGSFTTKFSPEGPTTQLVGGGYGLFALMQLRGVVSVAPDGLNLFEGQILSPPSADG